MPLPQFKAWLRGEEADHADDTGDLLGEENAEDAETTVRTKTKKNIRGERCGVTWNGRKCHAASGNAGDLDSIYPNVLVVLPASAGGWATLGYVPNAPAEPPIAASKRAATQPPPDEIHNLARIDEATAAFQQVRDRLILRVHPNLVTSAADRAALKGLSEFVDDENRAWHHNALLVEGEGNTSNTTSDSSGKPDLGRSTALLETRASLAKCFARQVQMVRYPGGFVVTGPRIFPREQLPRASFDDELDEHNIDADERISLAVHLADVTAETGRLALSVGLDTALAKALVAAAERHDLGKADLRFQAMLLGSSLDMAAMQPKLWAKSVRGTAMRNVMNESSSGRTNADQLPGHGFRHEMLSLELVQQIDDDLDAGKLGTSCFMRLQRITASARPLAPLVIDDAPPDVGLGKLFPSAVGDLDLLLTGETRRMLPAHRLDAGISERFWKLNRRFGWWGLAWLESGLRLADWVASAQPIERPLQPQALHQSVEVSPASSAAVQRLNCVGLNGGNPLGFLAALGLFQRVSTALDSAIRLEWEVAGGNWCPTLLGDHPVLASNEALLDWLFESLRTDANQHWLKRLNELPDDRLRLSRPSEYSRAADAAEWRDRVAADWLSCNGSDLCEATSNNQLQTARRDYFPESAVAIINAVTQDHLERTLFRLWDYADPIQKVSLHLEPREDRRHAYQWHKPVGDPTRALRGGMVGANRLAMEAWPLFQSVAVGGELQTVGFQGTRPMKGIRWTWPIWAVPLALCDVTPLLNIEELQRDSDDGSLDACAALHERGIPTAFRLRRILVEKTPNFTPAVAVSLAQCEVTALT